jgi:hypothetical protein
VELLYRFLIGGAVVSLFAAMGDVFRPKSFAGLFGAAPSIACASLALALLYKGAGYAAIEARSMMVGAAAFVIYAWVSSYLMLKRKLPALPVTALGLVLWLLLAMSGWACFIRGAAA